MKQNLSGAPILEDDTDWDIRIKLQLFDFASVTNILTQTFYSSPSKYADPTFPNIRNNSEPVDIYLNQDLPTIDPSHSPYNDNWDILWLRH